jgi:CRP/FNR family cyclic AMP-dependent transcriptional regulator
MDNRQTARLRVISLFEDLPEAELSRIAQACVTQSYERHAEISGAADAANDVFFVLEGSVRASEVTAGGREIIFGDIGVGVILGEFSAIDGLPRSSTMIAISDCVVARMPAEKFLRIVRENGAISTRLLRLLVAKIRRMSERVFELSALAVRERVRRELLRLASDGTPAGRGVVIRPAPSHYEFAARIGSHREAVTRELNHLEEEKIVAIARREIRILDLARLQQHGEEP